ncbi:MAG: replicative DNA helicase [Acidobacteriia bacterium]|nr:replicative DNA helicase [Terriglobia bacterium]
MSTDQLIEKSLPHNVEAERSVLGVILLDNAACDAVVQILKREDFYLDSHRRIFDRILQLSEWSRAIDLVTLSEELARGGELESIGGAAYLSSLTDGMPRSANVEYYARIVKEKALLRKMINVSNGIIQQCFEAGEDAETLLDRAENEIFQLAEDRIQRGFYGIKEIVRDSFETIEKLYDRRTHVTGVRTGYEDLDRMTSGLQPSELIILAARPSMGKTALALNIAENVAIEDHKTVGIFSLEMSKESLLMRLLCSQARVDAHKLRSGFLPKTDYGKLSVALGALAEAPIFIDDTPSLTVMEMRAKCRRLKKEHNLALAIVDYLQLMGGKGRFENRVQEVSSISRGLKALAKELRIPIVALSQLSRAPEKERGDHRPQLSDLRESGSIEQDADVVMFILREELYKPTEENSGLAELIIGKQRNGPVGKMKLVFLKDYTRFERLQMED